MGEPMVERLNSLGHSLTVYNRTTEKLEPLKDLGG